MCLNHSRILLVRPTANNIQGRQDWKKKKFVNFSTCAFKGVPTRHKKAHLLFYWATIYIALRKINIVVIPSTSQSRKSSPVCNTNLAFEVPMPDPRPSF